MAEFDRQGIEQAYAKIADTARNQYTLGYTTQATKSTAFRTIDVRVLCPNLNVLPSRAITLCHRHRSSSKNRRNVTFG